MDLLTPAFEAVSIDPDYSTRGGYDPAFLDVPVPLPVLSPAQLALAAHLLDPSPGQDPTLLDYHHYSVVMHRPRRIAWYAVVNVDGAISRDLRRETDKWIFDPRIERAAQLGPEIYTANDFDRGHLVRRIDPAWGPDDAVAKVANDDTFHFTNCSPQHERFNQGDALWAGLEDHLLRTARNDARRITVFNGPVLRDDDPVHRGALVPLAFWKVVAFVKETGDLSTSAYLISQRQLVEEMELEARFAPETFQVPVRTIADLTGLDLSHLFGADALDREPVETPHETTRLPGVPLRTYADLRI